MSQLHTLNCSDDEVEQGYPTLSVDQCTRSIMGAFLERYAEPQDIFDVDELALREAIASAMSAGAECAHGVASFRLSGLLDQSKQLVNAYISATCERSRKVQPFEKAPSRVAAPITEPAWVAFVAPRLKMRSEICQRKRREVPKGGIENWHLSDEERLIRWPGAYLDAGSTLGIRQNYSPSMSIFDAMRL